MANLFFCLLCFLTWFTVVNTSFVAKDVCDRVEKVEVHFRDYYSTYLGLNITTGELIKSENFYEILKFSVRMCCQNTTLEFIHLNSTKDKDIEYHSLESLDVNNLKTNVFVFYFPEFTEHKENFVYDF